MFYCSNTLPGQDNSLDLEIEEFDVRRAIPLLFTPTGSVLTPFTTPFGSPSKPATKKFLSDFVKDIFDSKDKFRTHGLDVVKVGWYDASRSLTSCLGPNITDMTLKMKYTDELLPVVRFDNFNDIVYTLPAGKISVVVGNEEYGSDLRTITLSNYLRNFGSLVPSIKESASRPTTKRTQRNMRVRTHGIQLPDH
jgi:hypothetical protein